MGRESRVRAGWASRVHIPGGPRTRPLRVASQERSVTLRAFASRALVPDVTVRGSLRTRLPASLESLPVAVSRAWSASPAPSAFGPRSVLLPPSPSPSHASAAPACAHFTV